jgi:hypothetical protein
LVFVLPDELPPIEPLVLGDVVLGEVGLAGLVELLLPPMPEEPEPVLGEELPEAPLLEPCLLK